MVDLHLSSEQVSALKELLDRALGDLSYEISNTDKKSFRDDLKAKRDELMAVREML